MICAIKNIVSVNNDEQIHSVHLPRVSSHTAELKSMKKNRRTIKKRSKGYK